jgi:serine/threonine-protein kinase
MQPIEISPNFQFLNRPDLAESATSAEQFCLSNPRTSLMMARDFVELCTKYSLAESGYMVGKGITLDITIKQLKQKGIINTEIYYLLNDVRKAGNSATHDVPRPIITPIIAAKYIRKIHKIALWYHYKFSANDIQNTLPDYQILFDIVNKVDEPENTKADFISQEIKSYAESIDFERKLSKIYSVTIQDPTRLQTQILNSEKVDSKISIEDIFVTDESENTLNSGLIIRGRYKIADKLGEGSFGVTYIAKDLDKPGHPLCVVKQLSPSYSDSGTVGTASRLFQQEALILDRLKHPEIPHLLASFEEDKRLFLVQEYIAGNTLKEELSKPWEQASVVQLLKDILTPLSYVHEEGIIHRDIKPDNLMRRADDEKIVIIDFGAVKQFLEGDSKQGTIIGTRGYMSPEQGSGHISYSCDVYAVGVIAVEALAGKKIEISESSKCLKDWIEEMPNIEQGLKAILEKMTQENDKARYSNAKEALEAISQWQYSKNTTPQFTPTISQPSLKTDSQATQTTSNPSISLPFIPPLETKQKSSKKLPKSLIAVVSLVILGFGAVSIPYFTKVKIDKSEIIIGTLWKPEAIQGLADYIEDNSVPVNYLEYLKGKKIKVRINGDETLSYGEAENRMKEKQWDIAFTNSPILSVFAKEHDFKHITGMFPGSKNYQAGFFVLQDSPIRSLNDINPQTRVALGAFTSASSFYMPVYDLYGKSIIANTGNRGKAIIDLVREGKADVGSAAIGDSVRKDDLAFRIIHVSRDIPGAGVYASPVLSESDRNNIKKLMLSVPEDIQKKANYGDKPEPDYTEFKKIVLRVQEILACTNFSKNPVSLACSSDIQILEGKINSVSAGGKNSLLKFSVNNQIYNIVVPLNVIKEIFGSNKLTDIQGRSIVVKTNQIDVNNNIVINQSAQLKLLP